MKTALQKYAFWWYNIMAWMVYYFVLAIFSPFYLAYEIPDRVRYIVPSFILIFSLTILYRSIYKRFNFENKNLISTIVQVVISAFLLWELDVYLRYNFVYQTISDLISPNIKDVVSRTAYGRVLNFMGDKITSNEQDWQLFYNAFLNLNQLLKFAAILIWLVIYNFIHYNKRFQELKYGKLIAENKLKQAELLSLRAQLNPHFLFNALNSIHALSLLQKENVADSILNLSDLMRYTLNYEKQDFVTVKEEMGIVEKYLSLEKIRYDTRLHYVFSIAPNTLDKKILPITVQTLAENAIKHGISKTTKGGVIDIRTYLENDFLKIEVVNTGQLHFNTPSVTSVKNGGIGIENTRRRLNMTFGDTARLDIRDIDNEKVIARLTIPITD
jgi:Histidine kinase